MKITSIELKHTNPSLGPHETITVVTLRMAAAYQTRVDRFLDEAVVNDTLSIGEYIEVVVAEDRATLEKVHNTLPERRLRSGQQISHLRFVLEGGQEVVLNDVYRQFKLSNFYPDFTKYMVDNGTLVRSNARDESFLLRDDEVPPREAL